MRFLLSPLLLLIAHACYSYLSRGIGSQNHMLPIRLRKLSLAPLDNTPLDLCEENASLVIEEVRTELGTIFGYNAESRKVGITGEINLEEVDGPTLRVSLKGRFWHATDTVIMRVENFVRKRIPEVVSVELDRGKSTIQDDNRLNTDGGKRLF